MSGNRIDPRERIAEMLAKSISEYNSLYRRTSMGNAREFLEFFIDIDRSCLTALRKKQNVAVPIDLHTDIHTTDHLSPQESTDSGSLSSILRFMTKEQRKLYEDVEKISRKARFQIGSAEESVVEVLQKASMKAEIIYDEIIQK